MTKNEWKMVNQGKKKQQINEWKNNEKMKKYVIKN